MRSRRLTIVSLFVVGGLLSLAPLIAIGAWENEFMTFDSAAWVVRHTYRFWLVGIPMVVVSLVIEPIALVLTSRRP